MATDKPVDAKALVKEAENAEHKETFRQLQRSKAFRVGIGARTETPKPSFFIEITINLAPGSSEVDIGHLEKTVKCLKALQAQKYTLTYQDGNCITCETALEEKNLTQQYTATTTLLKNTYNQPQNKPNQPKPNKKQKQKRKEEKEQKPEN